MTKKKKWKNIPRLRKQIKQINLIYSVQVYCTLIIYLFTCYEGKVKENNLGNNQACQWDIFFCPIPSHSIVVHASPIQWDSHENTIQ